MQNQKMRRIQLVDNVDATLIPLGTQVVLHAGEKGYLMEETPDGFTVLINGYTYHVPLTEAAALGLTGPANASAPTSPASEPPLTPQNPVSTPPLSGTSPTSSPPMTSEPQTASASTPESSDSPPRSKEEVEQAVWQELKKCFDPEIPVNLVDLGLIYDCIVEPTEKPGRYKVKVRMTLTAPGCVMAPMIQQDVYNHIISLPDVDEAEVELVWDPPWNQNMMSEAARLQLGLL